MSSDTTAGFVELAFQYGPFFFAIFFLLVISRWAYKIHKEVREDPAASEKDRAAYLGTFIGSFAFGSLLVAASVIWWLGYRPAIYVFQGTIRNLKSYEMVASDGNVFFKCELKQRMPDDVTEYRNEHFVVVQNTPFAPGQIFEIEFSKKGDDDPVRPVGRFDEPVPSDIEKTRLERRKRNRFQIQYVRNEEQPAFEIEFEDGRNILKKVPTRIQAQAAILQDSRLTMLRYVSYAPGSLSVNTAPTEDDIMERAIGQTRRASKPRPSDLELIKLLQDMKADVGTKIVTLEHLEGLDVSYLRHFIQLTTEKEPALVTILDLKRHSDKELAFIAGRLLEKIDVDALLARQLLSPNEEERTNAEKTLLRMDKVEAERILVRANPRTNSRLRAFAQSIASGDKTKALKPTGSSSGDRYYVKAVWDPSNRAMVNCLTQLFNSELENNRSFEREAALMKGRKERLVYSIDKQWALAVTDKITACGATALFVTPN